MSLPGQHDPDAERQQGRVTFFVWIGIWVFVLYCVITQNLLPEWRLNHRYLPSEAVVLDLALDRTSTEDGPEYEVRFLVRYPVEGADGPVESWAHYHAEARPGDIARAKALCRCFVIGRQYPCWYDPDDPRRVALSRGYSASSLQLVLGCAGVLGVSLVLAWRSQRRQRRDRLAGLL
jgi:hypothetical protein